MSTTDMNITGGEEDNNQEPLPTIQELEYYYVQQQNNELFDVAYESLKKTFKLYFEYQDKFYETILLCQHFKKELKELQRESHKEINILKYEVEKYKDVISLFENYSKEEVKELLLNTNICIVCKERDRNIVFTPCNHFVCCHPCSQELNKANSLCIICKHDIKEKIKVYCL